MINVILSISFISSGDFITRKKDVLESFKQAQIVNRSGSKIVEDIAKEIKYMMDAKISAVKVTGLETSHLIRFSYLILSFAAHC